MYIPFSPSTRSLLQLVICIIIVYKCCNRELRDQQINCSIKLEGQLRVIVDTNTYMV